MLVFALSGNFGIYSDPSTFSPNIVSKLISDSLSGGVHKLYQFHLRKVLSTDTVESGIVY